MLFPFLCHQIPWCWLVSAQTPTRSQFFSFFKKNKPSPQPSERLCCLTCNLGISSLSSPHRCSLSNDRQLNPAFLPHFYRFLGYKRFHLLMHVPASPRRGLVPWCSEHRDGDRGTSLVCPPRCHQASPCPRWIFGLRVGIFCARVVCARLRTRFSRSTGAVKPPQKRATRAAPCFLCFSLHSLY